jgi:hypothetical protein
VAAKLDLLGQQRLARPAIFGALVGKANAAGARQPAAGLKVELAADFRVGLLMA